jgi:hypothetical protein
MGKVSPVRPAVLAMRALRIMDAQQTTAPGTGPFGLLGPDEMPDAGGPDVSEVVHHAHAVLGSISLVQMAQSAAGEKVTTEAVLRLGCRQVLAGLYPAQGAGLGLGTVVGSAAWTGVLVPLERPTEAAVHSARGNQHHGNRVRLRRSSWRHVQASQSIKFHNGIQDFYHAPDAWLAYGIRKVVFLEVSVTLFCCQFTAIEQFAADEGAMLLLEVVHEFSRLLVGQFCGCPVVSFASAVLGSDYDNPAGHRAADFSLAPHPSPKTTSHFQSSIPVKLKSITEREEN